MDPAQQTQSYTTFKDSMEGVSQPVYNSTVESALALSDAALARFALSSGGPSMGYVKVNSSGWCEFSGSSNDGTQFEQYKHSDGKTYWKVKGGDYDGYYLSINNNAYVGVYGWTNAVGWHFEGSRLICDHNSQALSFYSSDKAQLYAWDQYNVLDVQLKT